jgi:uncharacterized protein YjiS (DUF1127 family)
MSIVLSFPGTSSSAKAAAAKPSAQPTVAKRPVYAVAQMAIAAAWGWKTRLRNRAELRALMERDDDRMLGDVGLTRAQVADEAGRPFWRI